MPSRKKETHTHTDCFAYEFANKIVENCNVTPLVNNLKHMLSVETDNKKSLIYFHNYNYVGFVLYLVGFVIISLNIVGFKEDFGQLL